MILVASHVDTQTASPLATTEERVGKIQADRHRTGVMGIVDSRDNSTVKPVLRSTWAA